MALRTIVKVGDDVLRKKCKPVTMIDSRIHELLDDMAETMHKANGVGLAAPQVGLLKRIVVIDIGEGVIELINPEILSREGEQTGEEGCLSVPDKWLPVTRPNKVKVRALNRFGKSFTMEGEGLLARAFCHEIDHLEGRLFIDVYRDQQKEHKDAKPESKGETNN
ncbi:MAG: peptide deformylase [Candidatus Spyradocola sp.]|jgi:peptide deformylase